MYLLAKAMLASVLGAGAVGLMEATPPGAFLIGAISVLMWISIAKDLLDLLRWVGL